MFLLLWIETAICLVFLHSKAIYFCYIRFVYIWVRYLMILNIFTAQVWIKIPTTTNFIVDLSFSNYYFCVHCTIIWLFGYAYKMDISIQILRTKFSNLEKSLINFHWNLWKKDTAEEGRNPKFIRGLRR